MSEVGKPELIALMLDMLQTTLDAHRLEGGLDDEHVLANVDLPLIGNDAALTSMGLVSFIADVESILLERHALELTLVSEQALSRSRSPFRSVDALADYVLELTGVAEAQR